MLSVGIVIVIVVVSSIVVTYETPPVITDVLTAPTTSPIFPTPVRHVIIIMMENAEYSSVIGNASATPYQDMLASKYALAAQYYATDHPSLPNYISLVAGSPLGISSDCDPSQCGLVGEKSIVNLLNQKGFSWKEYAESMPSNCSETASSDGLYYPRHDPFVYFSEITGNRGSGHVSSYCEAHVVPFGQFSKDLESNNLPNFAFITPNICDDAHSCPLTTGDNWLASVVPGIIDSPSFNSTVLFIVYDEGRTNLGVNGSSGGGHVACIVVSPFSKMEYASQVQYSHYSLLATVEAIYELGSLGRNDAGAPIMQDLFSINL